MNFYSYGSQENNLKFKSIRTWTDIYAMLWHYQPDNYRVFPWPNRLTISPQDIQQTNKIFQKKRIKSNLVVALAFETHASVCHLIAV